LTGAEGQSKSIYLFARDTGALVRRLDGLPHGVAHLVFSPTGRYLAAMLGGVSGLRFVLGTEWGLRAFDADGTPHWTQPVPAVVWAANITADGPLVIAAAADGTLRWHRLDDGCEVLALFPLADLRNWVAWTPEGV
jgi:hypothetical protein